MQIVIVHQHREGFTVWRHPHNPSWGMPGRARYQAATDGTLRIPWQIGSQIRKGSSWASLLKILPCIRKASAISDSVHFPRTSHQQGDRHPS